MLMSLILGLFLIPNFAFGYDYETHGFLTKQTTEFYNSNFPEKISQDLIYFLVDGSRREDDTPRWINHFYDPVYQRGYQPEIVIDAYPLAFAQTLEKVINWVSSKQWADSSSQQNRLVYKATSGVYRVASILSAGDKTKLNINSETDFSWETAKQYWLKGEKEKAMFALGHVLHLIQDASVPDHTRNDGHIGDSPYELWTSRFNLSNPDTSLNQRLIGKTPVVSASLGNYFESIAKYSNNNFYSKDTLGVGKGYSSPEISYVGKDGKYFYGLGTGKEDSGEYKLLIYKNYNGSLLVGMEKDISLTMDDPAEGDFVMRDYWSRLSPKAITHGAGIINLFLEEVETRFALVSAVVAMVDSAKRQFAWRTSFAGRRRPAGRSRGGEWRRSFSSFTNTDISFFITLANSFSLSQCFSRNFAATCFFCAVTIAKLCCSIHNLTISGRVPTIAEPDPGSFTRAKRRTHAFAVSGRRAFTRTKFITIAKPRTFAFTNT